GKECSTDGAVYVEQPPRHSSEVGAVCGNAARTVLCGGRSAMIVPTATLGHPTDVAELHFWIACGLVTIQLSSRLVARSG
ncbi:MAG TPA: hypothetical protein VNO32_04950, partial [Candidatus Acidoferrum sp.]|nr:hypothetical protein [Candidatus Acidoferrum sp.]